MHLFTQCGISPLLAVAAVFLALIGCGTDSAPQSGQSGKSTDTAVTPPSATVVTSTIGSPGQDEEHAHKPGTHGGIIIPIGSDSYHAEAVIESTGDLRLLMLQRDETRLLEVEKQAIKAFVKAEGDTSATAIELAAVPQDGDAADKTSQFMGRLPESTRGRQLDITIPNLRIGGERFRIGFTTSTSIHDQTMPTSLPADKEKQLYLTPAGKYTDADIKANGNTTASQKYKGLISKHDAKPKSGDRICPVSMTKANSQFTWIIDGKPYQFCCPPCVDEFVRMAKEQPAELLPPESFIKSE